MLEPDGAWTGRVVPVLRLNEIAPAARVPAGSERHLIQLRSRQVVKQQRSATQVCSLLYRGALRGQRRRRPARATAAGKLGRGDGNGSKRTQTSPPTFIGISAKLKNASTHGVTTLLGTHAGGVASDIPQRLHERDARRLLLARQDMAVVDDHIAPPRRSTTVVTVPVHHHAITHAVAHLLAGLHCGVPGPKRRLGQISVLQMRQRSHCTSVALPPAAWWWWCGDRVRWQRWRRRGWWRDGSRWRWRLAREGALDRELIVDPGVVVPDESPAQCRRIGDKRTHTKPVNGKNRIRFLACGPLQTGYLYLSVNCTLFFFLALLA